MTSIDIYNILSSKPHNTHYLNRYYKFILSFQHQIKIEGVTELHHICPKSKKLFPEYSKLKDHIWNGVHLTFRQHYIAHLLLWKTYHGEQTQAFRLMCLRSNTSNVKQSKLYEKVKLECISNLKTNNPNASGYYSKQSWKQSSDARKINQSKIMSNNNKIYKSKPKETRYYKCSYCNEDLIRIEFIHHKSKLNYYCNAKCRNIFTLHLGKNRKINHKLKICPHCSVSGKGPNMTRYHFDNCKHK